MAGLAEATTAAAAAVARIAWLFPGARNISGLKQPWRYRVYGLTIVSKRELPGLPESDSPSPQDAVTLTFRSCSADVLTNASNRDRAGDRRIIVGNTQAGVSITYPDRNLKFSIASNGRFIRVDHAESKPAEEMLAYLTGPILGFVLRLRGAVSLHAGAVALGERCVALVGENGAGKSTLVSHLVRNGYSLVTDDVLPVTLRGDGLLAHSGYPGVRLWADIVHAASVDPKDLRPLISGWEKKVWDLTRAPGRFRYGRFPIAGIFLLNRSTERNDVFATPLGAPDALVRLCANTYPNPDYPITREQRANELKVLSRLVEQVGVYELHYPDDLTAVSAVAQSILGVVQRPLSRTQPNH